MRSVLLILLSFWVAACSAHDERYYSMNPTALQKALKRCSEKKEVQEIDCAKLETIAERLNDLAYQLRGDPQEFGKQILSLQQTIAQQESSLLQNQSQPEVESSLKSNKQNLQERLAVVKWLMSPEG